MLKCQNSHLFLLSVVEMLKQVGTLYALLIPMGPGSRRSGGFPALAWWSGIWNFWFCWIRLLFIFMVPMYRGRLPAFGMVQLPERLSAMADHKLQFEETIMFS